MAYLIPKTFHRTETIIRRSRFITSAAHADSSEASKDFIARIREEFPDATHNCWAFVAGPAGSTAQVGMSDDGEPHGTAGRPMLNALLHSDVGEIAVVVTRYFGGVKLGTGGLVRAYSGAVLEMLESLPACEKIIAVSLNLIVDYPHIDKIRHYAPRFDARIVGEEYGADVSLSFELPRENAEKFEEMLTDITQGELLIEYKEKE